MKKKLIATIGTILGAVVIYVAVVGVSSNSAYSQTSSFIQSKMTSLMTEIDESIQRNPQLGMSSNPYDYIKNSQAYADIVDTGIKAVKPLYDMLYESRGEGLNAYIYAVAIQEITDQDYVYNIDYGWSNAMEFIMCYEMKVNNSKTEFERIMNTKELTEDEKIGNITELGVFAVGYLLDEYDKNRSLLSKNVIEESLINITGSTPTVTSSFNIEKRSFHRDLSAWRGENEEAYRSINVLDGLAGENQN